MPLAILTCSPLFEDLALNEIQRPHPSISLYQRLAPGTLLINAPCSYAQLVHPWQDRLPIYLHNLFRVEARINLSRGSGSLAELAAASAAILDKDDDLLVFIGHLSDAKAQQPLAFAWQDIKRAMSIDPSRFVEAPSHGRRILSVMMACVEGNWCAFVGRSQGDQNLSQWMADRATLDHEWPNRAGYKLVEALDVFRIRLSAGDHALDLGAAPGAWTTVLRERGLRVTAVAPRRMYDHLRTDPHVTHFHMRAEDYLAHADERYDLITNDMRLDARDSARLMVAYARHLRPEGIAIMTLKLRYRQRRQTMDHAFRLLRKAYKILRVRQLVFNRSEVTLFLRRKPTYS